MSKRKLKKHNKRLKALGEVKQSHEYDNRSLQRTTKTFKCSISRLKGDLMTKTRKIEFQTDQSKQGLNDYRKPRYSVIVKQKTYKPFSKT